MFLTNIGTYLSTGDEERFIREVGYTGITIEKLTHSLPSDEEMVDNFHKYRNDFLRLVELQYHYSYILALVAEGNQGKITLNSEEKELIKSAAQVSFTWENTDEGKDIIARTGVVGIDSGASWLNRPYSKDYNQRSAAATLSEKSRFRELNIYTNNSKAYSAKLGLLKKEYLYIPQPQKFQNGWLLSTTDHKGENSKRFQVASSLDWYWIYPFNWTLDWPSDNTHKEPCLIKPIEEPYWYIKLCRS
ncbi:hypothetical protein O5O45_08105 [Hahella aquimaris]|uniref:hypothetical protein n=1 Tax=Hahella sp. HNIBRBA332 TaxID=3015983 RepID=UPI00273B2848|nr:hypothetical protein [Hahella sp. HNIBRBA332]WLQ15875.1 hypothetical protein O5O45_08105 [Hahella sp. HNIBRBA332]